MLKDAISSPSTTFAPSLGEEVERCVQRIPRLKQAIEKEQKKKGSNQQRIAELKKELADRRKFLQGLTEETSNA